MPRVSRQTHLTVESLDVRQVPSGIASTSIVIPIDLTPQKDPNYVAFGSYVNPAVLDSRVQPEVVYPVINYNDPNFQWLSEPHPDMNYCDI